MASLRKPSVEYTVRAVLFWNGRPRRDMGALVNYTDVLRCERGICGG